MEVWGAFGKVNIIRGIVIHIGKSVVQYGSDFYICSVIFVMEKVHFVHLSKR